MSNQAPATMIEVSVKRTPERMITAGRHHWRQRPTYKPWIRWVVCLLAIPATYIGIATDHRVSGALIAAVLFLPVFSPALGEWRTRRAFARSPYCNEVLTMRFDDVGYHATSEQSCVNHDWATFTGAAEFSDGFLLLAGPSIYYWVATDEFVDPGRVVDLKNL